MTRAPLLALILLSAPACGYEPQSNNPSNAPSEAPAGLTQARIVEFDFADGDHGFAPGFADYPAGEEQFYALKAGLHALPKTLDPTRTGYMLSGNNHSDDLIMFVQGPIDDLAAGGSYHASMCVEFASRVAAGLIGVGGAPAESVFVKLGFVDAPIQVDTLNDGYKRIANDVGSQSNGGAHAQVVGNIAVDAEDGSWQIKRLCTPDASMQVTSTNGQAWAFVGFDSGYEATTTVYVTKLTLVLQ